MPTGLRTAEFYHVAIRARVAEGIIAPMSEGPIIPGGDGVLQSIALRIKLILRLMGDRRVSPLVKLIPLASIAYVFMPDLVLGPIDDAAAVWLGAYLFIEMCPPEVVREHIDQLTSVVEGSFREVSDDEASQD